jgi:hypothetical protein
MLEVFKYAGQAVVYAIIMAVLGYFSTLPAYEHFPSEKAMIKLTFAHGGTHLGNCVRKTREELMDLPPNMRKQVRCGRERVPITVELEIDGKTVYSKTPTPAGLRKDGPSQVYEAFPVTAVTHTLSMRMRDTKRTDGGWDYEKEADVELGPEQLFVIQFRPEAGGFYFN